MTSPKSVEAARQRRIRLQEAASQPVEGATWPELVADRLIRQEGETEMEHNYASGWTTDDPFDRRLCERVLALRREPFDYESLDPGIRDVVRRLRDAGFTTSDSGDGVSKPAIERVFDVPHVACVLSPSEDAHLLAEADRAARILGASWRIEVSYCPNDQSRILLATQASIVGVDQAQEKP